MNNSPKEQKSQSKPSPLDSDPVGKEYLDFAAKLKEIITPEIWKQLYYAGDIPKIIDLHYANPPTTSTPQSNKDDNK